MTRATTTGLWQGALYLIGLLGLFLLFGSSTTLYKRYHDRGISQEDRWLMLPTGKLQHLRRHYRDYDLIFWGDSRTFIGIDPDPTTRLTGLRSFNYGSMAHWFPTQYPQLERMVPYLKDKIVVWQIGSINFGGLKNSKDQMVQNFYLSPADFIEYWRLGFNPMHLIDNLLLDFLPSYSLLFVKDTLQQRFNDWLDSPLAPVDKPHQPGRQQESSGDGAKADRINAVMHKALAAHDDIFASNLEGARHASNVLFNTRRRNGQDVYYEIDSDYLREQQKASAAKMTEGPVHEIQPDPRQMALFKRMLGLFKQAGAKLIVVEYHDTPYHYRHASMRQAHDRFMARIEKIVKDSGFTYLRPDMSGLRDSDYFDYNHLNNVGSKKYSELLARELSKVVH